MNEVCSQDYTWKSKLVPRGQYHNKTENKTTVSLYLSKNLVEKARNHSLNLSKITEQALSSILDYLGTQNTETSSEVLNPCSFQENGAGPTGFEPAAYGLRVRRSSLTELRAHGNFSRKRTSVKRYRAYGYVSRFQRTPQFRVCDCAFMKLLVQLRSWFGNLPLCPADFLFKTLESMLGPRMVKPKS